MSPVEISHLAGHHLPLPLHIPETCLETAAFIGFLFLNVKVLRKEQLSFPSSMLASLQRTMTYSEVEEGPRTLAKSEGMSLSLLLLRAWQEGSSGFTVQIRWSPLAWSGYWVSSIMVFPYSERSSYQSQVVNSEERNSCPLNVPLTQRQQAHFELKWSAQGTWHPIPPLQTTRNCILCTHLLMLQPKPKLTLTDPTEAPKASSAIAETGAHKLICIETVCCKWAMQEPATWLGSQFSAHYHVAVQVMLTTGWSCCLEV